jgi:hypothetical protein
MRSTWTGECCTSPGRSSSSGAGSSWRCKGPQDPGHPARRERRRPAPAAHRPLPAAARQPAVGEAGRGAGERPPAGLDSGAHRVGAQLLQPARLEADPRRRWRRAVTRQRDARPAALLRLGAAGRGGRASGRCRSTSGTPIRAPRSGPIHTSCRRARPGPGARSTACSVLGEWLTSQRRPQRGPERRLRSSGPQRAQMS